jgi:predicted DNA-binding transcriptional regulator AlpA
MQKHILIALPLQEFETLIRDCIKSELQVEKKMELKPVVEYLTTRETAALLRISQPTLRKYRKNLLLKTYRIGSALRYCKHEVEQSLQTIRTVKHNRL